MPQHPLPLTQLKKQAHDRLKPITTHLQQQQQLHLLTQASHHFLATTIQRAWRRFTIYKMGTQETLIRSLLCNIQQLQHQVGQLNWSNQELKEEIQKLSERGQQIVLEEQYKENNRLVGVFKRCFNANVSQEVETEYLQQEVRDSKKESSESEKMLSDLMECLYQLRQREERLQQSDLEYQRRMRELQKTIEKQQWQLSQLQFEDEEVSIQQKRIERQGRFKEYL